MVAALPALFAAFALNRLGNMMDKRASSDNAQRGQHRQVRRLRRSQEPLYENLQESLKGPGAGGAFGTTADYYRDLLDPNSATAQAMFEPEMRRYREQIVPDIAEQFAGMGAGGLSSSGFRNAAVSSGADLSERLANIRANLRSQGAAGLASLGQFGLGDFINNVYYPPQAPQQGFLESAAPGIGNAAIQAGMQYLSNQGSNTPPPTPTPGPASPQFKGSQQIANTPFNYSTRQGAFGGPLSTKGKTSPYGKMGLPNMASKIQLPQFGGMQ